MAESDRPAGRRWFHVDVRGLEHMAGQQRPIVFHGVNKSGSGTMVKALFAAYRRAGRAEEFFTTYRSNPKTVDELRTLIEGSRGHHFFAGHYLYGSYRPPPEHLFVTQFRHPLPRVMSCYQWMKNNHSVRDWSFPEWVVAQRGIGHSQMMQFSIGFGPDADRLRSAPGDELLGLALENIERDVAWFGIAEYFEESVFSMAALCGLQSVPTWGRDNRNQNRSLVPAWTQEEIDVVREVYSWDFALYEWALSRFMENLRTLQFKPALDRYKDACAGEYKDRLDAQGRLLEHGPATRIVVTRASGPGASDPSGRPATSRRSRVRRHARRLRRRAARIRATVARRFTGE